MHDLSRTGFGSHRDRNAVKVKLFKVRTSYRLTIRLLQQKQHQNDELFPVGTMVRNKSNNLSVPENVRR